MTNAPICFTCKVQSRLTDGREVYPHRPDLFAKPIYVCDGGCGGRVGCHPGTTKPLGTPANAELRLARSKVHRLLDPLWMHAHNRGDMPKKRARGLVYRYLGAQLAIPREEVHTGMFDTARCETAVAVLKGLRFAQIVAWADAQNVTA